MEDLSYLDPPIEVSAESPRLEMIMQRLRTSGMRPYRLEADVDLTCADPLLIDVASTSRETLEKCMTSAVFGLKRQIVMLHKGENPIVDPNVVWVSHDNDLNLLPQRLISLARKSIREREVALRRETIMELGSVAERSAEPPTPKLLYIGSGSPLFLDLRRELEKRGIAVSAALSSYTAEDYLRHEDFTAVILNLVSDDDTESAVSKSNLAQSGEMTRLPVFVLLEKANNLPTQFAKELSAAAEVLSTDRPMPELINELYNLSYKYTVNQPFIPEPTPLSRLTDFATGLYSREFVETHLTKQFADAQEVIKPFCMLSLQIKTPGGVAPAPALRALADELRVQVRETDCPGVYDRSTLVTSLPMTSYRGAVSLAKRIAHRTYDIAELRHADVQWRVVERRDYHTAQTILGACVSGPFSKSKAA